MRIPRHTPAAVAAAALTAALAACGSTPGTTGPAAPVRPSQAAPGAALTALDSWWTSVGPDVARLTDDLASGGSSPAALAVDQNDVAALQADPGFPTGSPAGASAWHTALADFASAVSALQEGSTDTADALFQQGTTALNTVLASITDGS